MEVGHYNDIVNKQASLKILPVLADAEKRKPDEFLLPGHKV